MRAKPKTVSLQRRPSSDESNHPLLLQSNQKGMYLAFPLLDQHRVRDEAILVTEGDPSRAISKMAVGYGVDLIVMGTQLGGYRRTLIGSTTEPVMSI